MEIAVTLPEFVDEVPTLVVDVQWLVEIAEPVAEKLQRLELFVIGRGVASPLRVLPTN